MSARKDISLSGLIKDWGGFETLVAELHKGSTDIRVERGVELPAKEGRTYKIDVLIRSRQGIHEFLTIVECKWWNKRVERDRITHLKHVREQVGAHKAVCFSSLGFQAGAETAARAHDIGLFLVKEMTEPDWGRPGKVIDFYLQIHQAAVSPLAFPKALLFAPSGAEARKTPPCVTLTEAAELRSVDGKSTFKVIDLYRELRQTAFRHAVSKRRVWNDGAKGASYVAVRFNGVELVGGAHEILLGPHVAHASQFSCDVVFEIRQDRITIDRSTNLDFALVVEDYLMGSRYAMSRRAGSATSEAVDLPGTSSPPDDVLENGSIMCVLVDGFLDYPTLRAAKIAQDPKTELLPAS